jgi:hypothetical protein
MTSLPVSGLIATRAQTYFLPSEVAVHNVESDCWVSVLGKVFDITSLLAANKGTYCTAVCASMSGLNRAAFFFLGAVQ